MARTVLVVDDEETIIQSLNGILTDEGFEVISANSGTDALVKIEEVMPELILLDIWMPGIDGIETTRRIRAITPHTQVVALTAHTDDARVVGVLRAGAIGYVRKDAEPEILLAAVRAAARGQSVLDPAIAGTVLQELVRGARAGDDLTEREMEVLRLLATGLSNPEIAQRLFIATSTVRSHLKNIYGKLNVHKRWKGSVRQKEASVEAGGGGGKVVCSV